MFKNPPSVGQFALNGIWEKALSFGIDAPPSIDELKGYLGGGEELAFELFFDTAFFGARFTGSPSIVLELSEHCLTCLNNALDLNSFITAFGNKNFSGELCNEVIRMEAGAVNAWKSIRPYRLPTPARTLDELDTLWSELCATQLANDFNHPKAIELVYADPLPHWLGFPISTQQPPYFISKKMLYEVLLRFTSNDCNPPSVG